MRVIYLTRVGGVRVAHRSFLSCLSFLRLVPMLTVSVVFLFLIARSVFSNPTMLL
jgi:hypothetical protein